MSAAPLLEATRLVRSYPLPATALLGGHAHLRAVDDVSLTIHAGRSFGIVGESGSGKSTLARLVMMLETPDSGAVRLRGEDLGALPLAQLRHRRRDFQMVFQDPYGSLDPRQRVGRIVAEPLDVAEPSLTRAERAERIAAVLDAVGLPRDTASRYPHEFSGGQRQRIALARALVTAPALIVADEPVSALDVLVQAQVLNLMMDLQEQRGVTYLFISHNLAVVEHVADEVGVMYRGRIVERGLAAALFTRPAHPYTRALVDAIPDPAEPMRGYGTATLRSDDGSSGGCAFAPRCPRAQERCRAEAPALREVGTDRHAACHYPHESGGVPR
jgi:peptide/nickel transport system ATP-binding protein